MSKVLALSLTVICGLCAFGVEAADLGPNGGFCLRLTPSPLLETGDLHTISAQVDEWYAHSLDVSRSQPVIASARPAFLWASEAKVYCGMARGFLSAGEIDAETVSKCDCFHGRMVYFLH